MPFTTFHPRLRKPHFLIASLLMSLTFAHAAAEDEFSPRSPRPDIHLRSIIIDHENIQFSFPQSEALVAISDEASDARTTSLATNTPQEAENSFAAAIAEFPRRLGSLRVMRPLSTVETASDGLRILVFSGGGVRGVMEAYLVYRLCRLANKEPHEMFHIIAGTSVGAILAGAYSMPVNEDSSCTRAKFTSEEVYNIFRTRAKDLFQTRYRSLGGLLGPKYRSGPVRNLLQEFFGETPFQNFLVDTLVPSYNLELRKPKVFKSWSSEAIFRTRDVIHSSTVAPTYWAPVNIRPIGATDSHPGLTLCDGGVFANDPVEIALAEAKIRYPYAEKIQIVSVGSGDGSRPLHYDEIKDAGILGWSKHLVDIFMDGQAKKARYIMQTLFRDGEYSLWNPILSSENRSMDNPSEYNLTELIHAVDEMISQRRSEFEQLARRLAAPKRPLSMMAHRRGSI